MRDGRLDMRVPRHPRRRVLVASALALALAVFSATVLRPPAVAAPTAPLPLVVDTDLSTDDVVALLYLARSPGVDLRAVTVSGTGLVHCPVGAMHALRLLSVAGRGDVPVACGRREPLAGANEPPPEWRSAADSFFGLELPPGVRRPDPRGATALLAAVLEAAPSPVAMLALGPLTTPAELLRAHPGLRGRIAGITAMGGAVRVPGNVGAGHARVEVNLWVDPTAAARVLASGIPVTLVPLDATNQVPVTIWFATALRRYHYATPQATLAWDLFMATGLANGGQYFWDPLAATALVEPSLLRFAPLRLRVVTAAGPDNGRTVESARGVETRVALGASRPAFEQHLLGTLLGGASFAIPPARATATVTYDDGAACRYAGPRRFASGQIVFDTVNRGNRTFTAVVGRLSDGKTVADLRRVVRRSRGTLKNSTWFTIGASFDTPPRSRMTWVGFADTGSAVIACTVAAPRRTWVVTSLAVSSGR
jgi:pyrimidine-specific ribonucleoside hydrolase